MFKSDPTVSLRPRKPILRSHWNPGNRFRGLIETAETDPVVSLRPWNLNFANDYLEYLGEYEAICKTVLARGSGPKGEMFYEKTEGLKSRDIVPLITFLQISLWYVLGTGPSAEYLHNFLYYYVVFNSRMFNAS
jgi:hypothetical protein